MWFLTLSHPAGLTVTRISMLTFFQIYIFFQITSIKNIVLLLTHSPQQITHNNTCERMCIIAQRNDVIQTDWKLAKSETEAEVWPFCWSQVTHFILCFSRFSCHFPSVATMNWWILWSHHVQLTISFSYPYPNWTISKEWLPIDRLMRSMK